MPPTSGGASPLAWAVLGAVVAVVAIGLVAAILTRSNGDSTAAPAEEASTSDGGEVSVTVPEEAPPAETRPRAAAGDAEVRTTQPPTEIDFADRDRLDGRYVAMLWSTIAPDPSDPETVSVVGGQLADLQNRFGASVIAIDSNQFRSLRDGTIAVAFDGGFNSAVDAKLWCRENGFPGTQDCFGVVLSDDFGPDQRGDFVRVYDV
ncbi:MAG: hypothetical protein AAGA59_09385 [Actinomycetota bacterium]